VAPLAGLPLAPLHWDSRLRKDATDTRMRSPRQNWSKRFQSIMPFDRFTRSAPRARSNRWVLPGPTGIVRLSS